MPALITGLRGSSPIEVPDSVDTLGMTRYTLVSAAGDIVDLQDLDAGSGYRVLEGVLGLDLPPTTLYADDAPLMDGALPRGQRYEPRDVFIPLYIRGADRVDFRARMARLRGALQTQIAGRPAAATLIVTSPDGVSRQGACYYAGGLEGDRSRDRYQVTAAKTAFTLRMQDPLFYDLAPQVRTFTKASGTGFFPILPIRLVSNRLGTVTILNPGDARSFPTWEWDGPGTALTLTNVLSGRSLIVTKTISNSGAGADIIRIVTKRGQQSIADDGGTNLMPYAGANPDLWPIEPGSQLCTVDVASSTSDTKVTLTYFPAWLAAY